MKTVSTSDIKEALQTLHAKETAQLCLRLARHKKENKELLAYLLFNAHIAETYAAEIKEEVNGLFSEMNTTKLFFAKKTLRKILKLINKQVKFIQDKQIEAELRIHFCTLLKTSGIAFSTNKTLNNIYNSQLKKIKLVLPALHEDMQHDLMKQVAEL